jgi:hypothetical protein
VPLPPVGEQLEPGRVQRAVEAGDEVPCVRRQDVVARSAHAVWNCASSVEPVSASVELTPPLTACMTASK